MFFKSILLFSLLKCGICEKELLNIAGIFEYGEEEGFRNAMGKINSNKNLNLKFYLNPVELYPNDAFGALNSTCHVLKQGTVGIFGPTSTSNANMVGSICDAKEIPLILTQNAESNYNMQVNFYPHCHLLIDAYLDIINDFGWTDVTVLYADPKSLPNLAYLMQEGSSRGIGVKIAQIISVNNGEKNRPILMKLRESEQSNFMIYCQAGDLDYILLKLQEHGMLTEGFNYILSDLDAIAALELERFSYTRAKFIGVELFPSETNSSIRISPNLEANLFYDAMYLFSTVLTSLNITKFVSLDCDTKKHWEHGQKIVNSLKSISNYPGLTGPISFDSTGRRNEFELRIMEMQDGETRYSGSWNTSHGLNMVPEEEYDSTRKLTVITTLTEPYAMLKPTVDTLHGNDRYEGFVIDLMEELSQMCNFQYTFTIREDMRIGVLDPTTYRWSGMIGDILEQKADLAIGDVTITAQREDVVDFTIPFMSTGISILYHRPAMKSVRSFSVLDALPPNMWMSAVASCALVSIALLFLGRISPKEWVNSSRYKQELEYVENELTFMNSLFFAIGSITRQTYDIKLRSVATRTVAAVWWLFILVLIVVYIGNLLVILINPTVDYENDFADINELIRRAPEMNIKYGAKMGGATANFFRTRAANYPLYNEAWNFMESNSEHVMVNSNADGVEKVKKERYAFFMESTSIEYAVARNCDLQQVGSVLDFKGYGIAMRKNDTLRNCLNVGIVTMSQKMKLDELKRKWWEEQRISQLCHATNEDEANIVPLDLANFEDVFIITVTGTLIAFLLAIIEAVSNTVSTAKKAKIPLRKALRDEINFFLSFNRRVKPLINKQYSSMPTQGGSTGPYSEEKEMNVMK